MSLDDKTTQSGPALAITASAARRIAAIAAAEDSGAVLRIAVSGGGCSGFQYSFALDRTVNDDDVRFERDGAVVVVDSVSLELIAGSQIDFIENLVGAAFAVKNPQAKSSCGCGNSFALG